MVGVKYDDEDIFSRWLSINITDKQREPVVEINAVTAALQTACIASNNCNYLLIYGTLNNHRFFTCMHS